MKIKYIILILTIIILSTIIFTGCVSDQDNQNQKILLYDELLKRIYSQSPELNKNIKFIAIDIDNINYESYLEDYILEWLDEDIDIEFVDRHDLERDGRLKEDRIKDGVLLTIREDGMDILEIEKFRGISESVRFRVKFNISPEGIFEYEIIEEFTD